MDSEDWKWALPQCSWVGNFVIMVLALRAVALWRRKLHRQPLVKWQNCGNQPLPCFWFGNVIIFLTFEIPTFSKCWCAVGGWVIWGRGEISNLPSYYLTKLFTFWTAETELKKHFFMERNCLWYFNIVTENKVAHATDLEESTFSKLLRIPPIFNIFKWTTRSNQDILSLLYCFRTRFI